MVFVATARLFSEKFVKEEEKVVEYPGESVSQL